MQPLTTSAGVGGPSHFGGHGVQFADVTGDHRPDFYVTMNKAPLDMPDLFYRNVDGQTFAEEAASRGIDSIASMIGNLVTSDGRICVSTIIVRRAA